MADAQITVGGGKVVWQLAKRLETAGKRAQPALARALNRGGDMGRTQLFISLNHTTGISRQQIKHAISTRQASPGHLVYTLTGSGKETNIGMFAGRQGKKGVSAAPWKKRRVFKSSFFIKGTKKSYVRTSKERGPLHAMFGPNIGREMGKEPNVTAWERAALNGVERRLIHEIGRLF